MTNIVKRYSDADLEEFRQLIEQKLDRAKEQMELLQSQILEMTESNDSDYGRDMIDDSNTNSDVEMLNSLAIHQRKYVRELENALARIRHKTYGICEVSGELIDKKRLLAVPTTTKSLAAKMGARPAPEIAEETDEEVEKTPKAPPQRQILTKVIKKLPPKKASRPEPEDEDLILPGDDWEDDADLSEEVPYENMDDFSAEEDNY